MERSIPGKEKFNGYSHPLRNENRGPTYVVHQVSQPGKQQSWS